MQDRRPVARRSLVAYAGLGALAFVAALILLAGLALGLGGPSPGTSAQATAAAGQSETPAASPNEPTPIPSAASSAPATTSAAPSAGDDPVLVGAGDIGDCNTEDDAATAALLDDISGTVFTTGDNAYPNGTKKQFDDCYDPEWGRHKARTRPAPGNHEYNTKGAAGYLDYFGDAAVNAAGDPWYSYDLGAWHVIVLDSSCSEVGGCKADSPQGQWLAADLASSDARCTLAIWHESRFSSGFHGNDRTVGPFWTLLYAAGADVVVNGHDHDYERFAPQSPDGVEDRERGIREFVVGTGGTKLRPFEELAANSELRASVVHGVLKFTLHSASYDWEFIPTAGDFSDLGSARCH